MDAKSWVTQRAYCESGMTFNQRSDFTEFAINSPEGAGRVAMYNLFPGVFFCFCDMSLPEWPVPNPKRVSHMHLISFCVRGRCELLLEDNNFTYIVSRGLSYSTQHAKDRYFFPTEHFKGIQILIDPWLLSPGCMHALSPFGIDFAKLEEKYCKNVKTHIAQATTEVEAIISRLWDLYDDPPLFYIQLYFIELIHVLLNADKPRRSGKTAFTAVQVEIAKKAEQILTADIQKHYPIKKIAEQFSVSETSLKTYFRGVYGQNISSYLRDMSMIKAAGLLEMTQCSILEVAAQVGYVNQGKFAAVFKKHYGLSPLEFRRLKSLNKKR